MTSDARARVALLIVTSLHVASLGISRVLNVYGCVQGLVSSVFLLVGDVFTLINYCAFVEVLSFATCVSALLDLRYKFPNQHRPIKVHT